MKAFSFIVFPTPKTASIECVGQLWEAEKSLAIWMFYQLLNLPEDILPGLLEAESGWALEYPRL